MEDALALVACLHEQPDVSTALSAYETERRPVVLSTQRAAQASLEWFESIGQYVGQAPEQFAFNIVTRSRRITYDNLTLRDPEFVAGMDRWFADEVGDRRGAAADVPAVPAAGGSSSRTASSSHRWTCTRPRTGCRRTSTSSTSAPARSAAPGW